MRSLKVIHLLLLFFLSVAFLVVVMGTGVCRTSDGSKWVARIMISGKSVYLGTFQDEVEAAKVSGTRCSSTIEIWQLPSPVLPLSADITVATRTAVIDTYLSVL